MHGLFELASCHFFFSVTPNNTLMSIIYTYNCDIDFFLLWLAFHPTILVACHCWIDVLASQRWLAGIMLPWKDIKRTTQTLCAFWPNCYTWKHSGLLQIIFTKMQWWQSVACYCLSFRSRRFDPASVLMQWCLEIHVTFEFFRKWKKIKIIKAYFLFWPASKHMWYKHSLVAINSAPQNEAMWYIVNNFSWKSLQLPTNYFATPGWNLLSN